MDKTRTYTELLTISSFEDRFKYLNLNGAIGKETFGFDRYLNQIFYRSVEWKKVRDYVIIRDQGLDLASEDHPIVGKIYVHHMNPISMKDIVDKNDILLDPEYLISVSYETHNAIHYGGLATLPQVPKEREQNDTIPWR